MRDETGGRSSRREQDDFFFARAFLLRPAAPAPVSSLIPYICGSESFRYSSGPVQLGPWRAGIFLLMTG